MNLEPFSRQLQLLQTLSGNTSQNVADICEEFDISQRTFYRYVAVFRSAGFEISSEHGIYTIQLTSPFFANLVERTQLMSSEINLIAQLLEQAGTSDMVADRLRRKFHVLYGVEFSDGHVHIDHQIEQNTLLLQQAIRDHRCVVLHGYQSPHSQSTADRRVEPFKMLPNHGGVRCYEPAADACKTFKLSRIGWAELLDDYWQSPQRHVNYYTDPFGFSGETPHRIVLRLGPLATRILIEEYGVADHQLVIDADGQHRLFSTTVCSPQGVGRFVLGLLGEVEVLRGNILIDYLKRILATAHITPQP